MAPRTGTTLTVQALYNTGLVYTVQDATLTASPLMLSFTPVVGTTGVIALGGLMTVRMTISNTGGAPAYNLAPIAVPTNIAPYWTLFAPVVNDATNAAVPGNLTLPAGGSDTFRWVLQAAQSTITTYAFSASATAVDPLGGALASGVASSVTVIVGTGPSQASYLASSLVRVGGGSTGWALRRGPGHHPAGDRQQHGGGRQPTPLWG